MTWENDEAGALLTRPPLSVSVPIVELKAPASNCAVPVKVSGGAIVEATFMSRSPIASEASARKVAPELMVMAEVSRREPEIPATRMPFWTSVVPVKVFSVLKVVVPAPN